MARITKLELKQKVEVLETEVITLSKTVEAQATIVGKAKQKAKEAKTAKTKATKLHKRQESILKNRNQLLAEAAAENCSLICKVVDLKNKVATKNPIKVMKHWLESFKEHSTKTYFTVYVTTMIILGVILTSSAFGFGSLVKIVSTDIASVWTFNIINTIYVGLFVYIIGEFQGWWGKVKEKFNKK